MRSYCMGPLYPPLWHEDRRERKPTESERARMLKGEGITRDKLIISSRECAGLGPGGHPLDITPSYLWPNSGVTWCT